MTAPAVVTREAYVQAAREALVARRAAAEKAATVAAQKAALARIAVAYQVPAQLGAQVMFEGIRGRVVGADTADMRVLVLLDGDTRPDAFHPRWNLTWLEGNGRPTAVPGFPIRPAPALLTWSDGEGQWSGI